MKKRLLVLLLALLMMLSVTAPVLAGGLSLGTKLTGDELQELLKSGDLKAYYVKEGGALLEGAYLDIYGARYNARKLTANELVLYDADTGLFYVVRTVWTNDGLALQVAGAGNVDPDGLSETEVLLSVYSWRNEGSKRDARCDDEPGPMPDGEIEP